MMHHHQPWQIKHPYHMNDWHPDDTPAIPPNMLDCTPYVATVVGHDDVALAIEIQDDQLNIPHSMMT